LHWRFDADLPAVANEIDADGIVAVRQNEIAENLVSFFTGSFFGHLAEGLGNPKEMRIDRERWHGPSTIWNRSSTY
jgi:hypothetical protein